MKKKLLFAAPYLMILFVLVSCGGNSISKKLINEEENSKCNHKVDDVIYSNIHNHLNYENHMEYNEKVLLVKSYYEIDNIDIEGIEYESIIRLHKDSKWYKVILKDTTNILTAYNLAKESNIFDAVDLDYIMCCDGKLETIDTLYNSISDNQITYSVSNNNKKHSNIEITGGDPDVVVAVIDTGVDYRHKDLSNNIWKNINEIPNNGIDDDNNGYIDDYMGWDFVNYDNDPMDDNGHGTHVAGIIGAENNTFGSVGIAYNCSVMCLKAGKSTGSFSNDAIAEAIKYAYMNGASVINMSFGGSYISDAVIDILKEASNYCILVAAAGNNKLCNQPNCPFCVNSMPYYPACLPYVVGVMSCKANGSAISVFSNYDHTPNMHNDYEYDCYACGENVLSTWPYDLIGKCSGTSMASPVVAGIAALARSYYQNREIYSNDFIKSLLCNTGCCNTYQKVGGTLIIDEYHPFCTVYDTLCHTLKTVKENIIESTCDNVGQYDLVTYCTECDKELFRETKIIEKKGHNCIEWNVTIVPTLNNSGLLTKVCQNCNEHIETYLLPKLNKDDYIYNEEMCGSCISKGKDNYRIVVDGFTFEFKIVTDYIHKPSDAIKENIIEPTCETDGYYELVTYCSECGKELLREPKIIEKLGHDFSEFTYSLQGDEGIITRICQNNNEHIEIEIVNAKFTFKNEYDIKELTQAEVVNEVQNEKTEINLGMNANINIIFNSIVFVDKKDVILNELDLDELEDIITKIDNNDAIVIINNSSNMLEKNDSYKEKKKEFDKLDNLFNVKKRGSLNNKSLLIIKRHGK